MTDTPTIQSDSMELVRYNLFEHLDEAEFLALKYDCWSEQDTDNARGLISMMVTALRAMVAIHGEPADTGDPRCDLCDQTWPCPQLTSIHTLLKDPEGEFVKIVQARRRRS